MHIYIYIYSVQLGDSIQSDNSVQFDELNRRFISMAKSLALRSGAPEAIRSLVADFD